YDINILRRHSLNVSPPLFDTMVAAYLLNPESLSLTLKSVSRTYLSQTGRDYGEVIGEAEDFSHLDVTKAAEYSCEDSLSALNLKEKLLAELKNKELLEVFEKIEMPLLLVLSSMELKGVKIDTALLKEFSKELEERLKQLEKDIYREVGEEFNLNSPKQLAHILFDVLGIPTKGIKRTKTGISTDVSVLETLAPRYPVAEKLLQYRMLFKLKSTYVDALPKQVSPITGRLHTNFNQTIVATGRISSSDPNLQNIPLRTEDGKRIRKAFIAEEGNKLISADYSQIELRLLAHLSQDEQLIKAFKDRRDIHSETAREVLGIPKSTPLSEEDRRVGKTINYGIIYGMSGFRLARDLGVPVSVANEFIEQYFKKFPRVKEYFSSVKEAVKKKGYIETIFGRKRFLKYVKVEGKDAGFLRRVALNAPLQGSAADIIKLAMIQLQDCLTEKNLLSEAYLILQIHDELLLECAEAKVEEVLQVVKEIMENVVSLQVPLEVDVGVGRNWLETKEDRR
ncbi:MAG: DNA polymerase I, partial [Candidatus Dadabacteria bacterium]